MSVGAIPSTSSQPLGAVGALGELAAEPQPGTLPDTITDAQGRLYHLQRDPATGHPQYRHAAEQRDAAGNRRELEILIDLAPDGSFTRRTTQNLTLATGDSQREQVVASFDAAGRQVGEVADSETRQAGGVVTEHTVSSFAAGVLVRRETDVVRVQQQTDPQTREAVKIEARIHGTWDEGGQPITNATVPVLDRTDLEQIVSPGQGINKDTDRTITFTRHAAGPMNALDWDDAGKLVVRFDGRGDQYIERELRVPLGADGSPNMSAATVVRTDDRQSGLTKVLTQGRIWGGLVSNLSWIVGLNFARGSMGKGFLALSAAAAGAELVGEGHALATRRNDGDVGRFIISAYDMLLTGTLAAYMSGRRDARTQLDGGQRLALNGLGAGAVAANGAELLGANPIGADALTQRLMNDAQLGSQLGRPASPLDGNWRLEPRFDAARALLG